MCSFLFFSLPASLPLFDSSLPSSYPSSDLTPLLDFISLRNTFLALLCVQNRVGSIASDEAPFCNVFRMHSQQKVFQNRRVRGTPMPSSPRATNPGLLAHNVLCCSIQTKYFGSTSNKLFIDVLQLEVDYAQAAKMQVREQGGDDCSVPSPRGHWAAHLRQMTCHHLLQ